MVTFSLRPEGSFARRVIIYFKSINPRGMIIKSVLVVVYFRWHAAHENFLQQNVSMNFRRFIWHC
jgi:hypothetical protein